MNIKEILDSIVSLSGKNDKLSKLREHADNKLLQEVIYKAHSPRVKFYIKQIPEYESIYNVNNSDSAYTLEQMLVKIEDFSNRVFTGNVALDYLKAMLSNSNPDDAEVIKLVIGKNLKIGMDTGFNKVIPNLIEETPYQGAKSYAEKLVKKLFEKGKKVRSDIKADGTYRNAIMRGGEVELCSRQGEESILIGVSFMDELSLLGDCVLNGELTIDGEPNRSVANGIITSIMDIFKKGEDRGEKTTAKKIEAFEISHGSFEDTLKSLRYTVWDMLTIDEYFNKRSDTQYETRRNNLDSILSNEAFTQVSIIESKIVNNIAEAIQHFQEALARGLEGTILKSMEAGWKDGKPTYQVKMKLDMNIDLKIIGFLYGNKGTKNENVISRLQVESSCGLLKTQPSGMTEAQMKWVTDNQDNLLGTIVEIRCSGLSQDSEGNWSCMHPSVVEFRSDKNTCDSLETAQEIENMAKTLS